MEKILSPCITATVNQSDKHGMEPKYFSPSMMEGYAADISGYNLIISDLLHEVSIGRSSRREHFVLTEDVENDIRDAITKRDSLIILIESLFVAKGIEAFRTSTNLIQEVIKSTEFIEIEAIKSKIDSIVDMALSSKKILEEMDKTALVDNLITQGFNDYALKFLATMTGEEINTLNLDKTFNSILRDNKVLEHKPFLEAFSKTESFDKLNPHNTLRLLEALHAESARKDPRKGITYQIEPEKQIELSQKIHSIVRQDIDKPKLYYEKLVSELLDKPYYDKSIIHILDNHDLNTNYSPAKWTSMGNLDYLIASKASPKVLKSYLQIPNISLQIHSYSESLNMINIALKARKIFNRPSFVWMSHAKQHQDPMILSIEQLIGRIDESPEVIKLIVNILSSDKFKYIRTDILNTLALVIYSGRNPIFETILNGYHSHEMGFTMFDEKTKGVRLPTKDELEGEWPMLITGHNKVKIKTNVA